MSEVVWTELKDAKVRELVDGVRLRTLWEGDNGARAIVLEIDPGCSFGSLDVHKPGPEEVYVVAGIFNDGVRDYQPGTFIHNPSGSSHWPQSISGCTLFVFFPEG